MKKKIINILKILAFFSVGIILFWLVYRNQDMNAVIDAIKSADLKWLLLSAFLGILSHISRSLRWNLLIEPMGYKPRKINLILSVFIMYLTNLAIPRSGEVARCGIVSKYEKIPISKLIGTVISERVIDIIILLILILIVVFSQSHVLIDFVNNNPFYKENIINLYDKYSSILFIFSFLSVLGLFLIIIYRKVISSWNIYKKFEDIINNFKSGLISIIRMERKWAFISHSIFIWVMYFVMIYVCFYSFEFTSDLSLMTGLTVFVVATIGIVIPSPGGIGTWHFLAIETLYIYGVEKQTDGSAFAIATHESQTLMLIIVGFICFAVLPFVNKISKKETFNPIED